ncbi:MAG: hypothetical protein HY303_09885 [Candidatus Wallbacteria bacterium]|nr:hypothetical protein [Candidatus Wallbacteria bacterium]
MTPSRFSRGAPSDLPDKAERRSTARHAWREKKRSHTTAPRNAPGGEARLHERHVAGVVSSVQKTRCSLCCGGEDIWCSWTQRVLSEAVDAPVVGDRATAGVLADGTGVLTEIEPRRTKLARMSSRVTVALASRRS